MLFTREPYKLLYNFISQWFVTDTKYIMWLQDNKCVAACSYVNIISIWIYGS